jgi:hypothetical protein
MLNCYRYGKYFTILKTALGGRGHLRYNKGFFDTEILFDTEKALRPRAGLFDTNIGFFIFCTLIVLAFSAPAPDFLKILKIL